MQASRQAGRLTDTQECIQTDRQVRMEAVMGACRHTVMKAGR